MADCASRKEAVSRPPCAVVAHRFVLRTALAATCWMACVLCFTPANAQVAWEYSPYSIEAWVGFAPAPEFTPRFEEEARGRIEQLAEIEVGAVWRLHAAPLASESRDELVAWLLLAADVKQKALPRPSEAVRTALEGDKVLIIEVRPLFEGYELRAQELDCRTRTWGHAVVQTVWQPEAIPEAAMSAAARAFVPLGRIETVKDKEAQVRLKAGGLLLDGASPARIDDGAVLRPIIRRNDRYGEPRPGGIIPAPWTFLQVASHAGPLLKCEISSGVRGAVGSKSSARNERLALLVRPQGESTRLVLQSRGAKPVPLAGYEVYQPGESEERSKLLGVTDWRGSLDIPRGDGPLRTLIVKSGGQLLARLPLVPGLTVEERADLTDDQKRLEAEGAVAGLNAGFLDVVARRELLAARARKKIAAQDFPGAQQLIDELRVLDSRTSLSERLDQYQRDYVSPDKKTQDRLDKLFSDARALLNKHLDMRLADRLTGELTKAKAGST